MHERNSNNSRTTPRDTTNLTPTDELPKRCNATADTTPTVKQINHTIGKQDEDQTNTPIKIEKPLKLCNATADTTPTVKQINHTIGKQDEDQTKYRDWETDRKSTRLNSSHEIPSRMPSSA